MRDKRPVDELSIEELERILAIRKREARLARLQTYENRGRCVRGARPIEVEVPKRLAPHLAPVPTESEAATAQPQLRHADYFAGVTFEDELEPRATRPDPERVRRRRRQLWNAALTAVEIAAAIGLIVLMLGLLQSFEEVSRQSATLQAEAEAMRRAQFVPPTPTPLINLAAVVLPGGHTFRGEEAVFNLEEVPAQYRDQFADFVASLPARRPTPSREGPVRIRIPSIGVDSQIVTGDDWEALKLGVGHHIGSANPGERGNMVLSAHNDIYGEIFRHLDRLLPGDEIIVSTWTKDYTYVVQPNNEGGVVKGHRIVSPTDVWVLAGGGDTRRLTLISCYPYRVNNKRIVVFAVLKE
ncbi:MAG: class D sortase [Chloroflexi bacterium]|nr:class D sortase [Chloroflexota bacterium]